MTFDPESLINEFEGAFEEELKASLLKTQAKVIKDGITDRLADFATEIETSKAKVKEAYVHFKKLKEGKIKATDDDTYSLQAAIDEHFISLEDENTN